MPVLIQFRRDTAATWSSVNPTLAEGEVGLELDTGKIKIGNGSSSWANLTYFSGTTSLTNVSSNIVPSSDNVYDLGSPTKLWKHIYTAGGSIYLGNLKITNEDGKLGVTKVVNPGSVNETPDPVDSDGLAGSVNMLSNNGHEFELTANGTITLNGNIFTTDNNLGNIKINGGIIGTQGLSGNNSWGSYDLSIDPGGQSNAGIYISGLSGQASGAALQIYNIGDATSPIQLFGRGSVQMVTGIGANEKVFEFSGNVLALPPGGDILDSNGVSVLGGVSGPTGNLIIDASAINFVASSSSDVSGLSTMQLVPDTNAYANDQYLVIDPTQPNHIHIRAGGTIDNSNAVLFLGGEKLRVQVADNGAAGVYNDSVMFQSSATFTAGSADYTTATFTENTATVGTISMTVASQAVIDKIWALNTVSIVQIYNGTTNYYLKPDGNYSTPGAGQTATFGVTRIEPGDSWPTNGDTLAEVIFQINQIRQSKLEVNGSDVRIEAADDVRIFSRDIFGLYNYSTSSPIRFVTQYDQNVEYEWEFGADGNLQLPQTNMNTSPAPTSLPGIRFTDGTFQITAFTGTEFPTNIVNTHNNSSVIYVGGTGASSESLSVRTINDNNALGIEVNYSSANPTTISAFRAYPDPTNIYTGTNSKLAPNTDWDNFGNLTTVGDSMSFTVTDHGFHKIYRVLVIARSIPGGGPGVGDAYCVIEKLK